MSKMGGTHLSLSPIHFDTRSEEDTEKKVLSASVATAFARYDLPVPGGPYSKIPLQGTRLPVNKWGNLIGKITASFKASLAPSKPATSSQRTLGFSDNIAPKAAIWNQQMKKRGWYVGSLTGQTSTELLQICVVVVIVSTLFTTFAKDEYAFVFSSLVRCRCMTYFLVGLLSPPLARMGFFSFSSLCFLMASFNSSARWRYSKNLFFTVSFARGFFSSTWYGKD